MSRHILSLLLIVPLVLLAAGCSQDKNPVETEKFGEVSGTVTFVGAWPATGDVQVSIWASWPPAGPPAAASAVFTPGNNTQTYKIEGLSKGTYPVITAGWRDPANPANALVLGIYWAQTDSLGVDAQGMPTGAPVAIEVTDSKLVWQNIDMVANLDIAP